MTTVKLTPKQRLVLMNIQNEGYLPRVEDAPRIVLLNLGLIEKRTVYSPAEVKQRQAERRVLSNQIIALLRSGKIKDAGKAMNDLESHLWRDGDKAWFLTRAASRYLLHGEVTVKCGSTLEGADGTGQPRKDKAA